MEASGPDPRQFTPLFTFLALSDLLRRWYGDLVGAFGFTSGQTPYKIIFSEPGVALRFYGEEGNGEEPVLLIIPAPIKDASIWDLAPRVSVVRHCRDQKLRVYLIEWESPDETSDSGISDYADRFISDCLEHIRKHSGGVPIFAAGHSLGGTLAAIHAALYPEHFRGLILLGSPLHFDKSSGVIDALVAALPRSAISSASSGTVPGSLMSIMAFIADPVSFGWSRVADRIRSSGDHEARETHFRVNRWSYLETPMSAALFRSVVEDLYRDDRFFRGELGIDGKVAGPDQIMTALLGVVDPHCRVVPPRAMIPFMEAAKSRDVSYLEYEGDTGVSLQHVGMLAGRSAHRRIWPEIVQWIRARR